MQSVQAKRVAALLVASWVWRTRPLQNLRVSAMPRAGREMVRSVPGREGECRVRLEEEGEGRVGGEEPGEGRVGMEEVGRASESEVVEGKGFQAGF